MANFLLLFSIVSLVLLVLLFFELQRHIYLIYLYSELFISRLRDRPRKCVCSLNAAHHILKKMLNILINKNEQNVLSTLCFRGLSRIYISVDLIPILSSGHFIFSFDTRPSWPFFRFAADVVCTVANNNVYN